MTIKHYCKNKKEQCPFCHGDMDVMVSTIDFKITTLSFLCDDCGFQYVSHAHESYSLDEQVRIIANATIVESDEYGNIIDVSLGKWHDEQE